MKNEKTSDILVELKKYQLNQVFYREFMGLDYGLILYKNIKIEKDTIKKFDQQTEHFVFSKSLQM